MINGFVRGQQLTVRHPVIAADTINYLTALFTFHTRDWAGLEKWTHWQRGDVVYDIPLVNDQITEDAHLNLDAGEWTVWIHGNRYADGIVVQRITTDKAKITVVPTGTLTGEPFPEMPASVTEQILARLEDIEQNFEDLSVKTDVTLTQSGKAADAKAVGDKFKQVEEAIDGLPKSNDEEIEMLIDADLLPAVTTASGAILTDGSGNIILRY